MFATSTWTLIRDYKSQKNRHGRQLLVVTLLIKWPLEFWRYPQLLRLFYKSAGDAALIYHWWNKTKGSQNWKVKYQVRTLKLYSLVKYFVFEPIYCVPTTEKIPAAIKKRATKLFLLHHLSVLLTTCPYFPQTEAALKPCVISICCSYSNQNTP